MYGSWVRPKIAGMESSANSRSVVPIATITTSIGVNSRLPSDPDEQLAAVVLLGHRQEPLGPAASSGFSWYSSSSSSSRAAYQ